MADARTEHRAAEAEYRTGAQGQQKTGKMKGPWRLAAAAVLFLLLDRLLKAEALAGSSYGWKGTAEFVLFKNTGIAFSIPLPDIVFWPAAVVVFAVLVAVLLKTVRRDPGPAAIILFVVLGAASNLADRWLYDATIDYLLFFNRSAVNIADGMIVGGLVALYVRQKRSPHPAH